jgi:DNA-binding transcriptional regulator YiaG
MGYLLRMSGELHDWLTGLRDGDPSAARSVGEALTALMTEGDSLGPPLVIPVVRPALDVTVAEALQRSYQRGVEWAQTARRREADAVAVAERLRQQLAERESQGSSPEPELAGLRQRLAQVTDTRRKLTQLSAGRQRQVDAFGTRSQVLRAAYIAAQAEADIPEVIDETGPDGKARGGHDEARAAAAGRLREAREEIEGELNAVPWEQGGDLFPQAGLMELRAGDPDGGDVSILFAAEPPGTALLLAVLEGRAALRDQYDTAVSLSSQALRQVRSREVAEASEADGVGEGAEAAEVETEAGEAEGAGEEDKVEAEAAGVSAYEFSDAEAFLDEFFAGEASEVEAGAEALAARVRGQRLAELRERLGLTQAVVARRLGVRPERVAAIERAAPGATEVRALAGYVEALGGRLEIIADVGGEPVMLR